MIRNDHIDPKGSNATTFSNEGAIDREGDTQGQEAPQDSPAGFAELLRAMEPAYAALEELDAASRDRAIRWLAEALNVELQNPVRPTPTSTALAGMNSSHNGNRESVNPPTPRDFMSQKKPQSQVERVACLAYYLSHYRGTPRFKTPDITTLNTDAAGNKFGNVSRDIDNADRQNGYVVSAGNGAKQLTVRGEAVVEALPDREAVKAAWSEYPHKRKRSSGNTGKKGKSEGATDE
ncbi:hypothetical protein FHS35_002063 [Streptomyces umbrinus]|uniref:hypothetical protein n=1 Tax=Streptomyces umbrinus TaxID=67370 RepID=UPI00167EABE4|nr:hypothetical protein [Streptomyces umbrinus]MCR3725215.1 hypothetical protein [Streptomyces umbrinus]GHH63301.1 hypothetical protein GCM10018775_80830 [Streptomyces umbrinus]